MVIIQHFNLSEFLKNLNLRRVEVDEIWSYIKMQTNVTEEDSKEYDDVYSLTAIDKTENVPKNSNNSRMIY
jgi:hypothetical protein